jgi:diketogulonate reductase-like aldo/keto reductase
MIIPTKKLKTGFEMPVYGLGTWQMGGRKERDLLNNDKADILGIKTALDSGVTHIDTAEMYAAGYAEVLVGKAIEGYDRSKIFLASKIQKNNLGYEDILTACLQSLKRLNTDYLDLYFLHQYNKDIPLKDSMRAFDKLVQDGLVKHIGVCNFNKEHLFEAQSCTKNKIVCDQVHYNLMYREPEKSGLIEYCKNNDIFISAWRPVGEGDLLKDTPLVLKELCDKYKKTPSQIAINWLIHQLYVITLSKTSNPKHLEENLGAIGWEMEESDIERLRVEFPNQKDISNVVPLG